MKKKLPVIIITVIFSFLLWVSRALSDSEYIVTYNIPVKLVDFPSGYTTGTEIPDRISVKLKGNGWKLLAINLTSDADYLVSAGSDSGRKYVNLYNYLVENQWLSSDVEVVNISPDTLSFYVEKIESKKVAVTPHLNLNFKPGFGLAEKVKVYPDSVIVSGPASIVRTIYSIPTEEIKISNLDERLTERVNLKSWRGMSYRNSNVSVAINVQKIVDKDFANVSVKVNDVPPDRDVVLLPNKITIGLRSGIDILGRIDTSSIKAEVDYRDIVFDTLGSVRAKIGIPDNTTLLYTRPERLRYVIKKFN
jgi:YbbR domain-containing protein